MNSQYGSRPKARWCHNTDNVFQERSSPRKAGQMEAASHSGVQDPPSGTGEIIQWVKMFATKPDDLSSTPRTHDLHMRTTVCVYTHM